MRLLALAQLFLACALLACAVYAHEVEQKSLRGRRRRRLDLLSGNANANATALSPLMTEEQITRAEALLVERVRLQKTAAAAATSAVAAPSPTAPPAVPVPVPEAAATGSSAAPHKMRQPTAAPTLHPKQVPTSAPHTLKHHARKEDKVQHQTNNKTNNKTKNKNKAKTAAVSKATAADLARLGDHCEWTSPGFDGKAAYDLRPLHVADETQLSYHITNDDGATGRHPHELDYSFLWNLCGDVTPPTEPLQGARVQGICRDDQRGAVIQYANRTEQGFTMCHVIGRYDPGK